MERKKMYNIIGVAMGLILAYYIFWFIKFLLSPNFYLSGNYGYIIQHIPICLGFIGVVIFFATNFKNSSLLRLFMSMEILYFPFSVLFYILFFQGGDDFEYAQPVFSVFTLIGIVTTVALFVCSCIGLRTFSKEQLPKLAYYTIGAESLPHFSPAPASLRFVNMFIDYLIIVHIAFFNIIDNYIFRHSYLVRKLPKSEFGVVILEVILLLYFYLILEGIFKTTPGKCITATVIVNEEGENPSFAQICGRTLSRMIPFDALSFLGSEARGWHDSISGTYVVKSVNRNNEPEPEFTLDAENPSFKPTY